MYLKFCAGCRFTHLAFQNALCWSEDESQLTMGEQSSGFFDTNHFLEKFEPNWNNLNQIKIWIYIDSAVGVEIIAGEMGDVAR